MGASARSAYHRPMAVVEVTNASRCPQCDALLAPVSTSYLRWCEACEWNVGVEPPHEPDTVERLLARVTDAHGTRLRDALVADPDAVRPARLRVLTQLLAWSVLAIIAAYLVGGVVLVVVMPGPFAVIVLLMGIASVGLALGRRERPTGVVLRRREHPALFELVDEVADVVRAPSPRRVRLDHEWNASIGGRFGNTLTLGYPFVVAIGDQELVALLGHELGHAINGDPRRGRAHAFAFNMLVAWGDALVAGWTGRLWVFSYVGRVFARIPYGLARLLVSASLLDGQRAEYYADLLGARAGGSDAVERLLSTSQLASTFELHVQRHRLDDPATFFDELPAAIAEVPESERRRRMVLSERTVSRLDSTHPPTAYRRAVATARPIAPAIVLDARRRSTIDAELAPHAATLARRIRYGG